jgi:hypothetical protein
MTKEGNFASAAPGVPGAGERADTSLLDDPAVPLYALGALDGSPDRSASAEPRAFRAVKAESFDPGDAMKMLIAAGLIGLAACATAYAADPAKARTKVDDATAQSTADYETAKARCTSVPERDRRNCLSEANARYKAQVQGTKREHRDESTPRRDDAGHDKPASGARPG